MELKAIILLLTVTQGVCKELEVQQDPVINVTAGETAHLRCSFRPSGSLTIGSFRWYRGAPKGKEVNNDTHPTGIVRVDAKTFIRDKDASISILETLVQYQDTYYCQVELFGKKGTGNGTRLIVRKPENKPNSDNSLGDDTPFWAKASLIGAAILITIAVVVIIVYCSRRRQQAEVPLQNQPQLRQEDFYSEIPRDASLSKKKRNKKQEIPQRAPEENESDLQYVQLNLKKSTQRKPLAIEEKVYYSSVNTRRLNHQS
ncbi:uncharacterized protein LOC120539772 [Polypterus senegalus]|uniref:uncharacterized protein LOC120539772 n=1 Tax=Polypterus senegalus TaxID=55291 RepID=UPI0019633F19|nr:uncharacterized protein LOC120539772 [Polypterus senegalus]